MMTTKYATARTNAIGHQINATRSPRPDVAPLYAVMECPAASVERKITGNMLMAAADSSPTMTAQDPANARS